MTAPACLSEAVPMRLRFARSVRISMEGNAHFCRGLLATRYDDGDEAGITTEITDTTSTTSTSHPLTARRPNLDPKD